MTRHEIQPRRHCEWCRAIIWPYRGAMYATPDAAAHASARYATARANWRHMRAHIERMRAA